MKYSSGQINAEWAHVIIQTLISHEVDYFCLAPGSRSTPLALAIAENPKARSFVHFDERGCSFHALGYAKAAKRPAVLIVTSGTAVGNLFPAVMEAHFDRVPLILLTADRPAELRSVKANQTADQIKIFGEYVRFFFDLPSPNPVLPFEFLTNTVAHAIAKSLHPLPGPVQLNCPFPEPLFDEISSSPRQYQSTQVFFPRYEPKKEDVKLIVEKLETAKNGVILVGALEENIVGAVNALAQQLNWPIFPDIISSFRESANWEYAIPFYHHLLIAHPKLHVDAIIHIGEQCVSKPLLQWMAKQKGSPIINISKFAERCDPNHIITHKIIADEAATCHLLSSLLSKKPATILSECKHLSSEIKHAFQPFFLDENTLTEPMLSKIVEEYSSNHAIFFANSMPIRDADMFFFPQNPSQPIFANRGLSGIDGNIATCAGIAMRFPLIAIIGDQAFLHDLNSLAQMNKTNFPMKLIVINNGGGGIFSFFPTLQKRKDVLESHFAAAHEWTFEKAAELFSIPYVHPQTPTELHTALRSSKSVFIEVHTHRDENYELHQKINHTAEQTILSLC